MPPRREGQGPPHCLAKARAASLAHLCGLRVATTPKRAGVPVLRHSSIRAMWKLDGCASRSATNVLSFERSDRHVAFVHPDHVAAFPIFGEVEVPMCFRPDDPTQCYLAGAVGIDRI